MSGEEIHEAGRQGAIRAKRWLEATTRVDVTWVNPDAAAKLTFHWGDNASFSFDLGGTLRGGQIHGQEFVAEVKMYATASDLGTHWSDFLAKCFCAYDELPTRCDHFMWLSWAPFKITSWDTLCSPEQVAAAVKKHERRVFGNLRPRVDEATMKQRCVAVSDRLWLIVLSERQEELVIEQDDLDEVIKRQRRRMA